MVSFNVYDLGIWKRRGMITGLKLCAFQHQCGLFSICNRFMLGTRVHANCNGFIIVKMTHTQKKLVLVCLTETRICHRDCRVILLKGPILVNPNPFFITVYIHTTPHTYTQSYLVCWLPCLPPFERHPEKPLLQARWF